MTYTRTTKTHLVTAIQARNLRHAITRMNNQVFGRFPVAHPVQRMLAQLNAQASKLTSALDEDYHDIADDEEAKRYGNIYYIRDVDVTEVSDDESEGDDESVVPAENFRELIIRAPKDDSP